ncbi:DUF2982 domain-containing protein [Shewanella halifaxensis]|uniref:DUF2982 domain-containing protein n=1 Tax=Shewanella halifaxensis TaxID=271098 RepID=UPI000D590237|nr:DUF2982 domain-containing protein [Shewanella halifaxensis]
MKDNEILIKPVVKRNGLTFSFLGSLGVVAGISLFLFGSEFFAPGIVCFALGAIALVLGFSKLAEPEVSLKLTNEGFTYFHRRGQVSVAWENVQRIDRPRVTQGIDTIALPYIGVKVKHMSPVLEVISLRLAAGLLTEQRPLLMTASTQEEDLSVLENQMSAEFTPFIEDNDRFKGVLAMFGHRSRLLGSHLGYHLYISTDALDRPANEFIALMNQCKHSQVA